MHREGVPNHDAGDSTDRPRARDSGVYLLVLELETELRLEVGSLGLRELPPGRYVYVGSARKNLRARVSRHLRGEKAVRWHVDHLTTHPGIRVVGAVLAAGPADECALSGAIGRLPSSAAPIPGFGASDCTAGCPAHLFRVDSTPRR